MGGVSKQLPPCRSSAILSFKLVESVRGWEAHAEDTTEVAGEVYVRNLYGYLPSVVCALGNGRITPVAVIADRFP